MTFDKLIKEYEQQRDIFKDVLDKGNKLFVEFFELEKDIAKQHQTNRKMHINIRPYLNRKKDILEEINEIIDEKTKLLTSFKSIMQDVCDSEDMSEEQKQHIATNSVEWMPSLLIFNNGEELLDKLLSEFVNNVKNVKGE